MKQDLSFVAPKRHCSNFQSPHSDLAPTVSPMPALFDSMPDLCYIIFAMREMLSQALALFPRPRSIRP